MNVERLRTEVDASIVPADLPALWNGIARARKEKNERTMRTRLIATAVIAAGIGAVAMSSFPRGEPPVPPIAPIAAMAPSVIAPVDDWGGFASAVKAGRPFALVDGSRISADIGTQLEVLSLSTSAVELSLGMGRVAFDITPGGPRAWTIDAGLARIRVVGTRFVLTRTPEKLIVEVEAGVVDVDALEGERTRLGPGQSMTLAPRPKPSAKVGPTRPREVTLVPAIVEAPAAIEEGPSLESMLAAAESARRRGDHALAAKHLEAALAEFPEAPSMPMVAYSLGRLDLELLGRPEKAAKAYARALELGLPEALEEDAWAHLIEATHKGGDKAGAAAAAAKYRAAFPQGRRAAEVERWAR